MGAKARNVSAKVGSNFMNNRKVELLTIRDRGFIQAFWTEEGESRNDFLQRSTAVTMAF